MLDQAKRRPPTPTSGTCAIANITVGERIRKDMRDLASLAASIAEDGLLQPIVVSQHFVLLAGERRLRACRDILGWTEIPVQIVEVDDDET